MNESVIEFDADAVAGAQRCVIDDDDDYRFRSIWPPQRRPPTAAVSNSSFAIATRPGIMTNRSRGAGERGSPATAKRKLTIHFLNQIIFALMLGSGKKWRSVFCARRLNRS